MEFSIICFQAQKTYLLIAKIFKELPTKYMFFVVVFVVFFVVKFYRDVIKGIFWNSFQ